MKPAPKKISCTMERNLHNVMMGDPGSFFIDRRTHLLHIKTPAGVAKLSLNPFDGFHWNLIGDLCRPTLIPAGFILCGEWHGELTEGQLIEVNP